MPLVGIEAATPGSERLRRRGHRDRHLGSCVNTIQVDTKAALFVSTKDKKE